MGRQSPSCPTALQPFSKLDRQREGKPQNSSRRDEFILTASASLPTTGSDRIRQLRMIVLKIDYSLDSLPQDAITYDNLV